MLLYVSNHPSLHNLTMECDDQDVGEFERPPTGADEIILFSVRLVSCTIFSGHRKKTYNIIESLAEKIMGRGCDTS